MRRVDDNHLIILLLVGCGAGGSPDLSSCQCQLQGWVQHLERDVPQSKPSAIRWQFHCWVYQERTWNSHVCSSHLCSWLRLSLTRERNFSQKLIRCIRKNFLGIGCNFWFRPKNQLGQLTAGSSIWYGRPGVGEADAPCCCPVSTSITTAYPSSSGVFWPQSSWILWHATTKANLKLCMCNPAMNMIFLSYRFTLVFSSLLHFRLTHWLIQTSDKRVYLGLNIHL